VAGLGDATPRGSEPPTVRLQSITTCGAETACLTPVYARWRAWRLGYTLSHTAADLGGIAHVD
jgi:hypothetical protein